MQASLAASRSNSAFCGCHDSLTLARLWCSVVPAVFACRRSQATEDFLATLWYWGITHTALSRPHSARKVLLRVPNGQPLEGAIVFVFEPESCHRLWKASTGCWLRSPTYVICHPRPSSYYLYLQKVWLLLLPAHACCCFLHICWTDPSSPPTFPFNVILLQFDDTTLVIGMRRSDCTVS